MSQTGLLTNKRSPATYDGKATCIISYTSINIERNRSKVIIADPVWVGGGRGDLVAMVPLNLGPPWNL